MSAAISPRSGTPHLLLIQNAKLSSSVAVLPSIFTLDSTAIFTYPRYTPGNWAQTAVIPDYRPPSPTPRIIANRSVAAFVDEETKGLSLGADSPCWMRGLNGGRLWDDAAVSAHMLGGCVLVWPQVNRFLRVIEGKAATTLKPFVVASAGCSLPAARSGFSAPLRC